MPRTFRILNVFALPGQPLSGNPLCVVEDATGLTPATMQAVARQFNLSESTFVVAGGADTDATVRVFTPSVELAFAGHPTLGTAYVVGQRLGRDEVVLGMPAGRIPVRGQGSVWTLTANPTVVRPAAVSQAAAAQMVGLAPDLVVAEPVWVDSGLEQLFVQVADPAAVEAALPDSLAVRQHAMTDRGEALCYVWAWAGPADVSARLFFSQDTALVEDPATGSAAANLGGWLAHEGRRDLRVRIDQGRAVRRPSHLEVEVDAAGVVRVGGLVHEIGRGTLDVDDQDR